MTFTADKVVFEFIADVKKLHKAYTAQSKIALKAGDKAGDQFDKGFDADKRGRGLIAGLSKGIKKGAPSLKAALKTTTALTVVGAGLATGFAAAARGAIKQAADMKVLADVAGVTAERFQEIRYGARQFGIEGEKISDVLKDVNDKFGDFYATGAGPLVDFFEQIAPKVGITEDAFRGLSSDQALGLYVSSLEKAGANQQDMSFYMEALAGDATMLLPLLRNNGKELDKFSQAARDTGDVLSNEAAQGAQDANQKFNELGATLRGGLVAAIVELAPEIEDLTQKIIDIAPTLIKWAENTLRGITRVVDAYSEAGDRAALIYLKIKGVDVGIVGDTDIQLLEQSTKLSNKLYAINVDIMNLQERKENTQGARRKRLHDEWIAKANVRKSKIEDELVAINKITEARLKAKTPPDNSALDALDALDVKNKNRVAAEARSGVGPRINVEANEAAAKKAAAAAATAAKKIQDDARKLREENLTAEEKYQADLAAIRAVEADPMLLEIAGGEETVMRARIDALADLAQASDDVGAAHIALSQAIEDGTLTTDAALEASTRLNTEFGLFTKAQIAAREAAEKKNDELQTQLEYQRQLAEASGDYTEVTRLTRELEVLRQKGDLLRDNLALTEKEAQAKAQADVDKLSKAQDLKGFDDLQDGVDGNSGGVDSELARIDEVEQAKLELLESYRTKETEALRNFEALKTEIETEAENERREIKLAALDDQLALAEGVFGDISGLLKAAGKEDSKIAKAAAKAEKVIAIGRATVNTALGVSRALAEQPFPLNFITAGLVGAAGAVQIATIASSFKDGVVGLKGPGTERSDSIPANLSRGESVITARATRGNELGLARLNAGMSPEEAFGLGRVKYGFMDGTVAVGLPMARVPSVHAPTRPLDNTTAEGARGTSGGNNFNITVKDDKAAYAYADRKAKETEAKVPGLVAADEAKNKRARPR